MSNIPGELLDHIVDLLHSSQTPLRNCCLVSKSWVSRTRRHLFAEINFQTTKRLQSWKKTFPDHSTSPARYAKTLLIGCPQVVATAGADAGSWIASFSGVEYLALGGRDVRARGWEVTFVLFHAFSPVIKSIRVEFSSFPFPHFLNFTLSFPLLEDLAVLNCYDVPIDNGGDSDGLSTVVKLSSSPMFTGSLGLVLRGWTGLIVHRLLSQPGGIHFRKLTLAWFREEDISLTISLVERCSRTLESLNIAYNLPGTSIGNLSPHRQLTFHFH